MRRLRIIGLIITLFTGTGLCLNASPSIPTSATLQNDLIGRQLSEGTDKGYFPTDWYWNVEQGEISGFKIQDKSVSGDYCSFVVTMYLQRPESPTRYYASVQMDYSLVKNKWKLVLAKSKGIRIVRTGKYKDCISTKVENGMFYIKNMIDSPLIIGGVVMTNSPEREWRKFSVKINGMENNRYYGFSLYQRGGSEVLNYRIDFVELL